MQFVVSVINVHRNDVMMKVGGGDGQKCIAPGCVNTSFGR